MSPRNPEPSSGLAGSSTVRLRPGTHSPQLDNPVSADRPRRGSDATNETYGTLTVQVEDTDVAQGRPTVVLVRHSGSHSPAQTSYRGLSPRIGSPFFSVSSMPLTPDRGFTSAFESRSHAHLLAEEGAHSSPVPFSPVPLTPRPAPSRNGSAESAYTAASETSRLPTPDFSTRATEAVRGFLPRLFSLRERNPSSVSLGPPANTRVDSAWSCRASTAINGGSSSGDEALRPVLLPSLSTQDKLTQKFPRPLALKNPTFQRGRRRRGSVSAVSALEEGEGLGMDRVDRWSTYKWCLLVSVSTLFVYGFAGLVCSILTWWRTWDMANVMYVADNDILILITLASSILLLTFLVGISGTILNSRPILAVYALLLWPAFVAMLAIGYVSYKRWAFALDRKLNLAWSEWYTSLGRLIIQDTLHCCGYYNALHEATPSQRCYPRTPLPGCKGKLYRFEKENLYVIWSTTFSLVPLHCVNIAISLLCSNHVTKTFGKGITPKQYRLSGEDVRADAERLMGAFDVVPPVMRPGLVRASTSRVFMEDKEELDCFPPIAEEWEYSPVPRSESVAGLQYR